MDTNYNRKNRRKYSLKAHIVLVTKYRKQLLKGIISEDIKSQILDISHKYNYEIIAMETDTDHIHFLISYDTTDSICEIVKRIKQETTYRLWQKHFLMLSKNTGKRKYFGQMVILPVALAKFLLQQSRDTLKLKDRKEHGTPPTT